MNGIEKITSRLTRDAQTEIDAINAETEARCAEIMAQAEESAAGEYEKRMEKGRADCARRSERMAAGADMELRKTTLAFKQELVGEAFTKAVEAICALPEDEYIGFLASLAAEAAVSGAEALAFSEKDRDGVGQRVVSRANAMLKERGREAHLSVSAETADIPGGFIMCGGSIEVNCAVDTLVNFHRASLASQVAEILFR